MSCDCEDLETHRKRCKNLEEQQERPTLLLKARFCPLKKDHTIIDLECARLD